MIKVRSRSSTVLLVLERILTFVLRWVSIVGQRTSNMLLNGLLFKHH